MRERPVQDVSGLPTYGFGSRMTPAWGTAAFIALESTGFALAVGVYLYLAVLNPQWPLGAGPPDLFWSSVLTIALVLSVWPNHLVKQNARKEDLQRVRRDLLIMCIASLLPLVLRVFEFRALNIAWDQNAYGSIVWIILALHTTHLVTDVADTFVLTALMFTRHAHSKRFSDTEDNAVYWNFVVLVWLPIYALIYWFPRWWPLS